MRQLKASLIRDPRYSEGLARCRETPQVLVALTNTCNLACAYCSTRLIRRPARSMDPALAAHIIDQTLANGWELRFGQTYEPFLHPGIAAIVRRVNDAGRVFSAATNGLAIPAAVRDLPMDLLVSYSATEEDYALRGSKRPFAAYQDTILTFLRHRLEHAVPGRIAVQIADYGIFAGGLAYDKAITDTAGIFDKAVRLSRRLGLVPPADRAASQDRIADRTPLVLWEEGPSRLEIQPTKIMPNAYDAFVRLPEPEAPRGYCDSCHTTMSIQADGAVAFCCCDPTARAVAGHLTPNRDLRDFWLGREMTAVREAFAAFTPLHAFCTQCLTPVSEHIKPLLTVANPGLVATILRDHGVGDDLPWFRFPA